MCVDGLGRAVRAVSNPAIEMSLISAFFPFELD